MSTIEKHSFVTLFYRMVLESNQEVIFDTFSLSPATLQIGSGTLGKSFEDKLVGLSEGDEKTFLMKPEEAFGTHRDDMRRSISLKLMGEDPLSIGQRVTLEQDGMSISGILIEKHDHHAIVDFNHPLAGQSILFTVKIIGVL